MAGEKRALLLTLLFLCGADDTTLTSSVVVFQQPSQAERNCFTMYNECRHQGDGGGDDDFDTLETVTHNNIARFCQQQIAQTTPCLQRKMSHSMPDPLRDFHEHVFSECRRRLKKTKGVEYEQMLRVARLTQFACYLSDTADLIDARCFQRLMVHCVLAQRPNAALCRGSMFCEPVVAASLNTGFKDDIVVLKKMQSPSAPHNSVPVAAASLIAHALAALLLLSNFVHSH